MAFFMLLLGLLPAAGQLTAGATLVIATVLLHVRRNHHSRSGPLVLLAATLFLFMWARPLVAFTSEDFNLRVIELFSGIPVSEHGQSVYFASELASMVAFSVTVICFQLPTRKSTRLGIQPASTSYFANAPGIWIILMKIGLVASIVQIVLYLKYFLSGGSYVGLYILGPDAIEFPGLSTLSSFVFYGYIGFLLASYHRLDYRTVRSRQIWTSFFIFLSLVNLAKGARGEVLTQLLAGLWLFSFTGKRSISLRTWLISGVLLFLLSEAVGDLRVGGELPFASIPLYKVAEWFVYSQGVSGELVAAADDKFGVNLSNTRFLVAPLLGPIQRIFDPNWGKQSVRYGESSGLLSHELSFRVAPDYYLAGRGTGSSYIAESYCSLGLIGILISTSLITWYVMNGPHLLKRSLASFFLFSASLPYVLFVPRDSLGLPVVSTFKAFLILLVCWKLRSLYVRYGHIPPIQSC